MVESADLTEAERGAVHEELVDGERYVVEAARHEEEGVVGRRSGSDNDGGEGS